LYVSFEIEIVFSSFSRHLLVPFRSTYANNAASNVSCNCFQYSPLTRRIVTEITEKKVAPDFQLELDPKREMSFREGVDVIPNGPAVTSKYQENHKGQTSDGMVLQGEILLLV